MSVDVENWTKQIKSGVGIILKASQELLKDCAIEFHRVVKEATPIGHPWEWISPPQTSYVPGALKQSWRIDEINESEYLVINQRPYAMRVEYGWSKQAPAGMMRLTALSWDMIVSQQAKKVKL